MPAALSVQLIDETSHLSSLGRGQVSRYLTGVGQADGAVKAVISSHDTALDWDHLEVLPWWFRLDSSSLQLSLNGSFIPIPSDVQSQASEHHAPAVMHFKNLHLPPHSTLTLSYRFRKSLLHLSDYPPDAHHGFFIPAARLTFKPDSQVLYTDVLVSQSALPDFSMVRKFPLFFVQFSPSLTDFQRGHSLRNLAGILLWEHPRTTYCKILNHEARKAFAESETNGKISKMALETYRW